MRRIKLLAVPLLALVGAALLAVQLHSRAGQRAAAASSRVDSVGPTLVSNQTSYPLAVYGSGFKAGDALVFEGPFSLTLPATFIDAEHLAARLPPQKIAANVDEVVAHVTVKHADGTRAANRASLTVVNDAAFAEPYTCALTPDGSALYVASPTTDALYRYDTHSGKREVLAADDGPRALAVTSDGKRLVVADEFADALEVRDLSGGASRSIDLHERPQDLLLDGENVWVTTRQGGLDEVDLATGKVSRHALPGRQPRALAKGGDKLWVAQLATDDIVSYPGLARIAPGPGVRIVGGRTARYGAWVMGGKAARGLAYDPVHGLLFASTIGPNVGPNPDRVEVSMNGGVEVIDAKTDQVLLHRGLGAGVLEGLAIDPGRSRLYAADIALGRVLAFDTGKLRDDPEHAQVAELYLEPPAGTPHIRPDADFGVSGRAGLAVHSGPRALCLDAKAQRLYAVNRLSGTVSVLDVRDPNALTLAATFAGPEMWNQRERRLGDVVFFSDLGRSAMSCDACHIEGGTSGVLYAKTHPLRIYRVPTLRGIRDSAPYFTPSALPNLEVVARDVLGRNRFHNPDPSKEEIDELAAYQAMLAVPPNPNVGPDGAPLRDLALPDGAHGNAIHGMQLFEAKSVGCSSRLCHPSPTFSADQSGQTRNHFADVGTPVVLPLRPELQEQVWKGWPPPPLVGTWDIFPLLESGAGGLTVKDGSVVPDAPFALRAVLDHKGARPHGNLGALTKQDENDLLAYLLSL